MNAPYRFQENAFGIWTETAPQLQTLRPRRMRSGGVAVQQSRLTWTPSTPLAESYLSDTPIEFDVDLFPDENRRLVFLGGYGPFIQHAGVAALAIMEQRGMPAEQVFSYRFMTLVFNRMRAGQEHRTRKLVEQDLVVRRSGRGGPIEQSVLPEYVGLTDSGEGKSWSVYRLMQRGRELAATRGLTRPSSGQTVACGIMAAARLNPLADLNVAEVDGLMFQALFECGDLPMNVSEALVDDVMDRLREAVEEHGEDAWADFSRWFAGAKSNLVQTLARKSGRADLPRETVKAALMKLGWRSYRYIAGCLSIFAQAVRRSVAEPLNDTERRSFDAMYLPQPHFGGLPLVLLLERSSLIEPVVSQMWENPDDESLIGTLHRMLTIYSDVAGARRIADRRFKSLRRPDGKQAYEMQGEDALSEVAEMESTTIRFSEVAGSLLERTQRGCSHCIDATHWEITGQRETRSEIRLVVNCARHDFSEEYVVRRAELKQEDRRMRKAGY